MSLTAEREWPPLEDHLDPPEITRYERQEFERLEAPYADPEHGDFHFRLNRLLATHLAEGYVGSVDLKTRVAEGSDFASDTCIRKDGDDPRTGVRYLEELVFEIVSKRSLEDTDRRARAFAERGVRRQIAIFVQEGEVREWSSRSNGWKRLDPRRSLRDPCLAHPLPVSALLDATEAEVAMARALEAKGNPAIADMKQQNALKGEARGRAEGEARGRAIALLTVLAARGFEILDPERQQILATTDPETLDRWLQRAATADSLDEVLGE
ncbi:MAG: hypothetical protein GY725_19860 [bacterium]|nr:hypothetical protein [bacterium]